MCSVACDTNDIKWFCIIPWIYTKLYIHVAYMSLVYNVKFLKFNLFLLRCRCKVKLVVTKYVLALETNSTDPKVFRLYATTFLSKNS